MVGLKLTVKVKVWSGLPFPLRFRGRNRVIAPLYGALGFPSHTEGTLLNFYPSIAAIGKPTFLGFGVGIPGGCSRLPRTVY